MRFSQNAIVLLLSSFLSPISPFMHGFTDPLIRIRHMIPPTIARDAVGGGSPDASRVYEGGQSLNSYHVYESANIIKHETPCLLFFTGGNSLITHEIYSNFLATLSNKRVSVYTIPFRYSNSDFTDLVRQLKTEYADVVAMSHSSGSVPLIDAISHNSDITKVIMMDPIDARVDRRKRIHLKHIKQIMLVRAEKAYEGETLSFIPGFLELGKDKLKLPQDCNIKVLDAEEYGHCDLLNPMYSNLVHQYLRNICDGSMDRTYKNLFQYIDWLTNEIVNFAEEAEPL